MTTTLIQTPAAGFPDRPLIGGVGLRVLLDDDGNGALLNRPVPPSMAPLHVRFMLRIDQATGGRFVPLRALVEGEPAIDVVVDADSGLLELNAGGSALAAALPTPIAWHCVELACDAAAQTLTLWINGRPAGEAAVPTGTPAVDAVEFGCPVRDAALAGVIDLDELIVADAFIGPVVRPPLNRFADDPARWLVLYNRLDPASRQWAEAYRVRRGLPLANLLGLDLSTAETIDEAAAAAIADALTGYLDACGLAETIVGLLLGHGVPGVVQRDDGIAEPLASMLQCPPGTAAWSSNPLFDEALTERPDASTIGSIRLAARLDGPTPAESMALLDRADAVSAVADDTAWAGKLWLDAATEGAARQWLAEAMWHWGESPEAGALRIAIERTAPTDPPSAVGFASIADDAFFWGWGAGADPTAFFAEPPGLRVFAVQLDDTTATAPTLREASATGWAGAAIQAGYAAAAGTTDVSSLSAVPRAAPFFEALRRGWTLAEAWAVATPLRRARQVLIGDPLMTVRTPRAGFDVLLCSGSAEDEDEDEQVIARLPRSTSGHDVAPAHQPPVGAHHHYRVHRIDGSGRTDGAGRTIAVAASPSGFAASAARPLWPRHAGWPPQRVADAFAVVAIWADRLGSTSIQAVELEAQSPGEPATVVATAAPAARSRRVRFEHVPTAASLRYRFRVVAAHGAALVTPWSAAVSPDQASPAELKTLE